MSSSWTEQLQKAFRFQLPKTEVQVPVGIYHYRREAGGNITRFHLRVDEDGSGLLVANASVGAILSRSGVWIAKGILDGTSTEEIRDFLHKNFRENKIGQIDADITRLNQFIKTLSNPEDNYPIFNFDDPEVATPRRFFAPYHAQLRIDSPEKIRPLLEKLWNSGFLHITFSANFSDSPDHAVAGVERAEDLGMICGMRACGAWLQSAQLFDRLAMAGVDYVVVPIASSSAEKHDALFGNGDFDMAMQSFADCKKMEVCPVAEIPLFEESVSQLEPIVRLMNERGVYNVQYYAIAEQPPESALNRMEVIQAALLVEELAASGLVRYVWQVPVVRSGPLSEVLKAGPRTPEDLSILVDPDGSVYLSRGPKKAAGNLLQSSWKQIWNGEASLEYRKRILSPTHCDICPGLAICAADCPGEPASWAREDA